MRFCRRRSSSLCLTARSIRLAERCPAGPDWTRWSCSKRLWSSSDVFESLPSIIFEKSRSLGTLRAWTCDPNTARTAQIIDTLNFIEHDPIVQKKLKEKRA